MSAARLQAQPTGEPVMLSTSAGSGARVWNAGTVHSIVNYQEDMQQAQRVFRCSQQGRLSWLARAPARSRERK